MRHLWSLLAGLVITPLAWLAVAVGQSGLAARIPDLTGASPSPGHLLRPLAFLAGAGLLLGLIACLRISPAGPVLAGLLWLAPVAGALVAPGRTLDLLGYVFRVPGTDAHGDLTTPLTSGVAPLVGLLLLVALAVPGRWRRWPTRADGPAGTGETATRPLPGTGSADDESGTGLFWPAEDESPTADEPAGTSPTRSALFPRSPERTPAPPPWPADASNESTDPLPAPGRSPWGSPLRDTASNGTET